ncbi:MAG TPA: GNAT family N-acetyltransferase [Woeseiaceae bacterium]|nr:GNAT family N-acetyltransferase [Woeseiaceae bacterium]
MTTEIRQASIRHIDELIPLVRAYHDFEGVTQDDETRRKTVSTLLLAPELGPVWLIFEGGQLVGYIAICLGYSIEFGGRDAFIDEYFLLEDFRGKGIGGKVLGLVLERLKGDEVKALHLEVGKANRRAKALYTAAGFVLRDQYHLMSREL